MNDQSINTENTTTEEIKEYIPSMDEFKEQIDNSFKRLESGDIIKGTVIGISDTELTIDLGYYAEGIIRLEELSNNPQFSIKADVTLGEEILAVVLREDKEGNILLSRKKADDILAWDKLHDMLVNKTIATVKVSQVVNAGVVTYLNGIRAFIPASKLSLEYSEDLNSYVGKSLDVIVITADKETNKLVLSAKDVLRDRAIHDKNSRISKLQIGLVTTGTVEKIMPFGAFVNIGEDLTGLVHISQICGKRIKSPGEVLKVGDQVNVKILDVKEGKISLSIKAVEEEAEIIEDAIEAPIEYSTGESATTDLGSLLKGFKF